jgi:hypothetical protein
MSVQIGGQSWAQWNWMDRFGTAPVPRITQELQAFFTAVNPRYPQHQLSLPNLPNQGNPATDIGFRIRIAHPIAVWSVLMRTITLATPIQHTSRDKLTLSWETGWDAAYRPNGSGLAYGDFDPNSTDRWSAQFGMPYINYADVGGTLLMNRDTTAGQESIFFWLANHGTPVGGNPFYAPQWFSLSWQPSLNGWLFLARSYRNLRPAGTEQSGPSLLANAVYPNGTRQSGLSIGMQNQSNALWTNPYLTHGSVANLQTLGLLDPGGEGPRLYYPPGMVAGNQATTATTGQPFQGARLQIPEIGTLHLLGSWSTVNTSLSSDDFLLCYAPAGATVPAGWLPLADCFPWGAIATTPPLRVFDLSRPDALVQLGGSSPDGQTVIWPQMVAASDLATHPFYARFAPDLVSGGGGGGGCSSGRPEAGVLWPRRG